ncbi:MAG TPA: AAA family ATPase [Chloroflexota bacterium]|nr:AAA family ATPase [Chloroflexota bacterium]
MFNVCPGCGLYSVEKAIDPSGPFAICPSCGHRHLFVRLPLFVVTGASGAGKTTVSLQLPNLLSECVVLESDLLWRPELDRPENQYRDFRDLWLRLAKNVHQSGRSVVLLGSAVPESFENSPERRYLRVIHYLALVCDDGALATRLSQRPGWRNSHSDDFVKRMVAFNRWLREHADTTTPPLTLLETIEATIEETVGQVARWVRQGGMNANRCNSTDNCLYC